MAGDHPVDMQHLQQVMRLTGSTDKGHLMPVHNQSFIEKYQGSDPRRVDKMNIADIGQDISRVGLEGFKQRAELTDGHRVKLVFQYHYLDIIKGVSHAFHR